MTTLPKYLDKRRSSVSSASSTLTDEEEETDDLDVDTVPFLEVNDKKKSKNQDVAKTRSIPCRRSLSRSKCFCCVAIVVALVALLAFVVLEPWTSDENENRHNDPEQDAKILSMRRCSYEDLDVAFRGVIPPRHHRHHHHDFHENVNATNGQCWSLADEVLRIPIKAIDRKHMVRLGAGYKGGVYAVTVHLSGHARHGDTGDKCIVAMKSDHCHMKNPLRSNYLEKRTTHSCVERGTFLYNPTSFMGAEYNGALLYHAIQHMKKPAADSNDTSFADHAEEGILPTWGVVHDIGHPTRSLTRHKKLHGMPHRDATIKAVIMPIVDFESLYGLSDAHRRELTISVRSVARALLPAARGLAFIAGMRFALRDVQRKNIGFRVDPRDGTLKGFMYDYSYLTYQDDAKCTLSSGGCEYCMDKNFHHHMNRNDQSSDAGCLINMIVRLLQASPDRSAKKHDLIDSLRVCSTAQDIVDILEHYQ